MQRMDSGRAAMSDRTWMLVCGGVLVTLAGGLPFGLYTVLGKPDGILAYVGLLVTAGVGMIAHLLTRQANRRLDADREDSRKQLKLEAAMRAGALFQAGDNASVSPAAAASALLALTRLGQAELAVALLVDLWSKEKSLVSTETAILVIDAALRSEQRNAQLVAAELLCRHAEGLDACQSLHWPSLLDGGWDPRLGPRTKLLLIEALLNMSLAQKKPTENALRSLAVRLYGIWHADEELRSQGCIATLISAIVPQMEHLGYQDFVQGDSVVHIAELEQAAATAHEKSDMFIQRIVDDHARRLADWASRCNCTETSHGHLAAALHWRDSDGRLVGSRP